MPKRACIATSCFCVCTALVSLLLPGVALGDPLPLRIMPLGDSITVGSGGTTNLGGYRNKLFTLLTDSGYAPDFVGTQTNNSSLLADQNHQGQGGWRIAQIDSSIEAWLNAVVSPDFVLLHIGTNDFGNNDNISTAINRLDALILKIATLRPNANIIVTNLMERGEPHNTNIQNLFNPQVPGIVDAHAALGRKVTFLDMRSAVPLADMPDNLHPNDTGYDKMADAWMGAIQAVISPPEDLTPPTVMSARPTSVLTSAIVRFSKPVADTAANVANYSIPGLNVTAASLSVDMREVTLTTSEQTPGTTYTITINNIVDRQTEPVAMAPNSTATFAPPLPRGYAANVPESAGYTLLQALDLPLQAAYGAAMVPYSVDNRAYVAGFDRVAYYLELELLDGNFQYAWVSMDAFTSNVNHLGMPTFASGAIFEQGVTNMNVASNVAGVAQGTGLTGNLEFWPTNYTGVANSGIGSSGTSFDFDDTRNTTGTFGSMQIHDTTDKKTVLAINDWGQATASSVIEVGIGNQPTGEPDWTHSGSGSLYLSRKLYVLVRASGDTVAPTVVSATGSNGLARVYLEFSEPLQAPSVSAANFALSHGATVLGAELAPNGRKVILTTTLMPAGQPVTVTINGVRDTSPAANAIAANTVVPVAMPVLPTEVTSTVGAAAANYQLVYSIDLPQVGNLNALGSHAYSWDDSATVQPFSRVAYYLETQKPGAAAQYVWVSMKAFTLDRRRVGIPTAASRGVHQMIVNDMEVLSNVAGVTPGSGIATGNIEFWPTDYSVGNGLAIPGADVTKYDFGDTRSTSGSFGSMQVHNHGGTPHTVFAINHWGADGNTLDVGIGNNTTSVPDWTNAANAGTYYKRRLHVMVLPGPPELPAEVVAANVADAQGYQLVYSLNIPAQGNLTPPSYAVNNTAQITTPFSRIAYFMELTKGATKEHVWVSADAFTTDVTKIGVPTAASGAIYQQVLSNMNVASNKAGVTNGTGIATGNIEFWPTNYTAANEKEVPGASPTAYDFGDTRSTTGTHGSMQIHNHVLPGGHTLFSLTNWASTSSTPKFGIGIGNNTAAPGNLDWTLTNNGDTYDNRVLHVLVLPGDGDYAPPAATHATGASSMNQVSVTFNEAVAEFTIVPENFSIAGLTVTGAKLQPGQRNVVLTTSPQTGGAAYVVSMTGIRDISTRGNMMAAGTTVNFTAYAMPALISSIPQAQGYQLVHQVALPAARPQWNLNVIPYSVDEPKFRNLPFDRVAYVMELDGNWVFASFDRHTPTFSKLGIPTLNVTSTPFQMNINNLTVASNVAGIVTGDFATGGNIEFWGGNYNGTNALNVPNASSSTTVYDWGDRMDTSGGYGSLQVHNYSQSQVLFAYNNWGSNSGSPTDIGIGNQATSHPDWTMSNNASTYTTRNLYVLVRPVAPTGNAPVILASPTSRTVSPGSSVTFGVTVANATSGLTYQWRRNGQALEGQTWPWLELTGITGAQTGGYDVVVTGENQVSSTSAAATLTITNQAPTFSGYQFSTPMNTAAVIPVASLLANASDLDGDVLVVSSAGPSSTMGGAAGTGSGSVTYAPPNDHVGADSFIAVIQDGRGGSVNGTVQVSVIGGELPTEHGAAIGRRADGKVDLAFRGQAGVQYNIRRSLTLADESWEVVATVRAGDDGVIPFVDPDPPEGRAFYQIVPHAPPP